LSTKFINGSGSAVIDGQAQMLILVDPIVGSARSVLAGTAIHGRAPMQFKARRNNAVNN